jgi:hypothetical protein
LRDRANIPLIERPHLLSVAAAAISLGVSDAYVRRLLLRQRLYGIKVGSVWAIFPDDLEAFRRSRRPPGRPAVARASAEERQSASRVRTERSLAGTDRMLRRRPRSPSKPHPGRR